MPKTIIQDGKRLIDTGLPQRQIKPIWLEMHKEMNMKIMDAILNNDPIRVKNAIRFSISMILDDEVRDQVKADINKKMANIKETSNEARLKEIETIYIEAMESVSDYLDQAFGISHRIAIGID